MTDPSKAAAKHPPSPAPDRKATLALCNGLLAHALRLGSRLGSLNAHLKGSSAYVGVLADVGVDFGKFKDQISHLVRESHKLATPAKTSKCAPSDPVFEGDLSKVVTILSGRDAKAPTRTTWGTWDAVAFDRASTLLDNSRATGATMHALTKYLSAA